MASWVEELFPPKFKVNDLFDDDQTRPVHERSNERFRQIYEDVFEEMLSTRDYKEALEHDGQRQAEGHSGEEVVISVVIIKPFIICTLG